MSWDDFIRDCKFGDIAFECIQSEDDLSATWDYQTLVNRPGSQNEFRARNPRRFTLQVALYTDQYQVLMEQLTDACELGKVAPFTHPVFGDFPAATIDSCRVGHSGDDPDSATMQIVVQEHTPIGLEVTHFSIPLLTAQARQAVTDTEVASEVFVAKQSPFAVIHGALSVLETPFQIANQSLNFAADIVQNISDEVVYVLDIARQYVDTIERITNVPDSIGVESQVNRITDRISGITDQIADHKDEETSELAMSLIRLIAALQELASKVVESRPPLTESRVEVPISLLAWAHATYGDSSRVSELLYLNTILDPLILPAGFIMRHYDQ